MHTGVQLDYAHHCGAEAQRVPRNIILIKVIVFVAFLCFPSNKNRLLESEASDGCFDRDLEITNISTGLEAKKSRKTDPDPTK